jgi:hypothetical protein
MMIDKSSPNQFAWMLGVGIAGMLGLLQLSRVRKNIIRI